MTHEVRDRGRIDEQGDRHLAVRLAYEELLARPALRLDRVARGFIDHEVVDRDAGIESVKRLEAALDAR